MYDALRKRIDDLLTGTLLEGLKAVDVIVPEIGSAPLSTEAACRSRVGVGHVLGTPEARYRVEAMGMTLELYVQLNVYRLVVVYRIPGQGTLDHESLEPRFARWALGATNAGWNVGWQNTLEENDVRWIEVYCYACLPLDFLSDERHQLYWTNDVVQMTRSFLKEARKAGVDLQPRTLA